MPTIYYDTCFHGLVPVAFIGWAKSPAHDLTGCVNAVVKLKRAKGAYQRGEVLHLPASAIVEKAGRRNYHQLVRSATLPARPATSALIPARV